MWGWGHILALGHKLALLLQPCRGVTNLVLSDAFQGSKIYIHIFENFVHTEKII